MILRKPITYNHHLPCCFTSGESWSVLLRRSTVGLCILGRDHTQQGTPHPSRNTKFDASICKKVMKLKRKRTNFG